MATRQRSSWILILFLLAGIVLGGLIGELAGQVDFLWGLGYRTIIWTNRTTRIKFRSYLANICFAI